MSASPVGAVERDVYLLTASGDVKRGAGPTVGLVAPSSNLELAYQVQCARDKQAFDSMDAAHNA